MKPGNLFHRILAGPAFALAVLIMLAAPASATPPVTADLKLHLDASQLTGLSDGATVTTWNDMSGLGNHATAAGTPIYKTGVLNGQPVIRFNDSSSFTTANLSSQFPTAATGFIVTTINNDNSYTLVRATTDGEWWRYSDGKSYPGFFRGSRLERYCDMPVSGSHLFSISSSASAWEMSLNGISQGVAGGNFNAGGALVIGNGSAGQGLDGDIAEILIYNRVLSAAEADQVGVYLAQKYGLATSYGPPVISSLNPADNDADVVVDDNLVATFNEAIVRGTGDITVKNLSDGTQTTIAVTDTTQVSISGKVLTINPAADLAVGKNYVIQISPTAIKDIANNSFAGIANDTTWNITTVAQFPYQTWTYSGSLFILTTPDGANITSGAAETNFPLLVRFNSTNFPFNQAAADGRDIRFTTATGTALSYEIEQWDSVNGRAAVWVKIPSIAPNARQEIKVYWGKADAVSKSKGESVFNDSNGYCSVLHMNGNVLDSTGLTSPVNNGATPSTAVIGSSAWRLQGIKTADISATNINHFPTGKQTTTTGEVWIRARLLSSGWTMPLAWGNKNAYGWNTWTNQIGFWGSPSVLPAPVTCLGAAMVTGSTALAAQQWYHVAYTSLNGTGKIYINGVLDATASSAPSPGNTNPQAFTLLGDDVDVDEARISSVARSDNWLKMTYENQKPLQTLAGPLVQPGTDFSVSEKKLTVLEGKSASVSVKAGGAQKVYWILKKDGLETIAAVDTFSFLIDAGRVTGDQSLTLQCKAVFADKVKTLDIPVTIQEAIPDPVFTLKAPAKWDGRETIEIVSQLSNLKDLQQKNVGELKYDWKISGMAVIKEIQPGKLILTRSQNSGKLAVTLTISNGGKLIEQTATIVVTEPKKDPWLARTPAKDEKPEDGQFYARDDKGLGTLYYNGTLTDAADTVFLKLYAADKLIKTETAKPAADKSYTLSTQLKPGLIQYKVEFGTKVGGKETVLQTVNDLVCGDAYIIDGQSNALATDTAEQSPPETNQWIRSYGRPSDDKTAAPVNLWCYPVWKAQKGEKAELGWWGMELAKRLVESQKVPIFILNAAVGGTRIDQHLPNPTNRRDTSGANPWTNPYKPYGSLLTRVEGAKLTHGIRAILWHQGENNQGTAGPTGDYDWKSYQDYFLEMSAAWKTDFPNVKNYYVFQIWPNSCGMGGSIGSGDMLREKQRTLPYLFSNMSILSTLGVKPPGGCHYPLEGWAEFARMVQPIIERDHYGVKPTKILTAPNLKRAAFADATKDTITLEFDQPVMWLDLLANQFYLDGEPDHIGSASTKGNILTLKLKSPSTAKNITYLKEVNWKQETLLIGENGIAALTFCEVPIEK